MANPSRTEVVNTFVSSTFEHRRRRLVDGIYTSAPFMLRLKARDNVRVDGGTSIDTNFIHAKFVGGSYGRGSTFDTSVTDFATSMRFDWKFVYIPVNLNRIDIDLNAGTPGKVFDIVDAAMENARLSMVDDIATQLFADGTGNAGLDLDGLGNAVSRTGTYGGITRAATGPGAAIRAALENSDGGILAIATLNSHYGTCTIANEMPDLMITTQTLYDRIWERVDPSFRRSPGGDQTIGMSSIKFNAADVVVDNHCTSGAVYFLNMNYMKMYLHNLWDFRLRGPMEPTNQQTSIAQLVLWGNFISDGPRFQGVATGLT